MSVDINQLALKSNEVLNKQKSSKKIKDKLTGKGMDLTNGLSEKELKKIDKNGDGKVTQKEFIENFDKRDQNTAKNFIRNTLKHLKKKQQKKKLQKMLLHNKPQTQQKKKLQKALLHNRKLQNQQKKQAC